MRMLHLNDDGTVADVSGDYVGGVLPPGTLFCPVEFQSYAASELRHDGGVVRVATQEELDTAKAAEESARQAAKSVELKATENALFQLCEDLGLSGKPGFQELESAVEALLQTDPQMATILSLKLLTVDAQGKREGGLHWWDDAAYHPELDTPAP